MKQNIKKIKLTQHTKKLIAILIISQILIVFFIKIINLRIFDIIGSILGIIILITIIYKIIIEKQYGDE